eukprot:GEZU01002159.1.p1 GENE.GEZU01002159.1~~GEZU01002159.1.p1  ORF type:complete len:137 (+),score=48.38 GEZU01002159.1:56-412(+)
MQHAYAPHQHLTQQLPPNVHAQHQQPLQLPSQPQQQQHTKKEQANAKRKRKPEEEINPEDLVEEVLKAAENDDNERRDELICSSIDSLLQNPRDPDRIQYMSLVVLAKKHKGVNLPHC